MSLNWHYRCATCGTTYEIVPGRYVCDACARRQQAERPLAGILEAEWEGEVPASLAIPLPVEAQWFPPIPVGNTPLWAPERLRRDFAAPRLWLKDDTCNPSGSFKDRASYLVAAFARKQSVSSAHNLGRRFMGGYSVHANGPCRKGFAPAASHRAKCAYSKRNAFTGSMRAANHAGMNAERAEMTRALVEMMSTSRGSMLAGISAN